jgi:hypothetical protein
MRRHFDDATLEPSGSLPIPTMNAYRRTPAEFLYDRLSTPRTAATNPMISGLRKPTVFAEADSCPEDRESRFIVGYGVHQVRRGRCDLPEGSGGAAPDARICPVTPDSNDRVRGALASPRSRHAVKIDKLSRHAEVLSK